MPESKRSLADVIRQNRDHIVGRYVRDVEAGLSPGGLNRPLLADHIPSFLDEVADELDSRRAFRGAGEQSAGTNAVAREHGEQRWLLGFDIEALVREYGVLHNCVLVTANDHGCTPTLDEHAILARCLSAGVAEATAAYAKQRDVEVSAQKERLEFLAEAGDLLSSSLDYRATTSRLTRLVVPRMADWCVIHLQNVDHSDAPMAHVDPAKVDLLRTLHVEFPPPTSSDGHRAVLRTGQARLIRDVADQHRRASGDDPRHLDMLTELATTSMIMVPLCVQSQTFGALTLGFSQSGRRYDEADFSLALELARRAASAIDNARLYELSQSERSRVEAAARAKDEFVSMVSHELRTPLNAMLGWLRMMRSGLLDDAKRQHAFEVIERNAEAQDRLVADLLDISRVITGKLRIKPSQVDLSDVVEIAVETVRTAAEAKRIKLDVDLERENSVLRGDAERLEQVAWNLLSNAVKFTPKGGTVRVRLRRVESDLELVVEDNGEGIDANFLPFVFEIFQQSDRSFTRPHGGLGIGLSIAKHIVDLHGGTIVAWSAGRGAGSRFSLRLPISSLISSTLGITRVPATTVRDPVFLPTGLTDVEVLVVEDDPDARELITVVLESSGIVVRSASSVADALAALAQSSPTVICSDIGLLDQDGYALIRKVRASSDVAKSKIPAIALAAFGSNEERTRALVEGFNIHLTKPVEPAVLVRTVMELSGRFG